MVTAKDKLRLLLSKGLDYSRGTAIAFSFAREADKANKAENGIEKVCDFVGMGVPDVNSAGPLGICLRGGCKLAETFKPDLMYLSTTDYIQHKTAPGTKIANDFYAMIDGYLGRLDALVYTVLATADHGMNDKHHADKSPNVVYLEPLFRRLAEEARHASSCRSPILTWCITVLWALSHRLSAGRRRARGC